jgi:hypothetical protein
VDFIALRSMKFRPTVKFAVLVALLVLCGCRRGLTLIPSSSFLSGFSLRDLVKSDRSSSGMSCAKRGLGGNGGSTGSLGRRGTSISKSDSFSCQINATGEETFDANALIASLKTDVEKDINRSGASILNHGNSDPTGFFFEYSQGAIKGRIEISGKQSGPNYYSLQARLDEKSDGESK